VVRIRRRSALALSGKSLKLQLGVMSLFAGGLADRIAGKVDAIDAFDNAFQIAGIANVMAELIHAPEYHRSLRGCCDGFRPLMACGAAHRRKSIPKISRRAWR
jgi:hypothetical protein